MKTLQEAIRPTTFIKPDKLRAMLDIDLTIASETFQNTGSFKFRAGYNVALNVPNEHLITASSGNFGQALAYSCKLLGKKCHVVMPETSAQVKIDAVRNYGAIVDLIDVKSIGRDKRVEQLMSEYPDAYRASAYDDPLVIDGNSSLGDELHACGMKFDAVIVPVGGAGLISGITKAFCNAGNQTPVIGAEPLIANDAARSLAAGEIVRNEEEPMTLADGARTVSIGKHNWAVIKNAIEEIIEVTEKQIRDAIRLYYGYANLKCEPTGALSLGAVIGSPDRFRGKSICLVVSGGNVDAGLYSEILNGN